MCGAKENLQVEGKRGMWKWKLQSPKISDLGEYAYCCFKSIKVSPKIEVKDKETLSLVYTPGVGAACKKIEEDKEKSFDLTNRENSVAVISTNYKTALERAIFLKSAIVWLLNIYKNPLTINC